jgi:hypothetical protein
MGRDGSGVWCEPYCATGSGVNCVKAKSVHGFTFASVEE